MLALIHFLLRAVKLDGVNGQLYSLSHVKSSVSAAEIHGTSRDRNRSQIGTVRNPMVYRDTPYAKFFSTLLYYLYLYHRLRNNVYPKRLRSRDDARKQGCVTGRRGSFSQTSVLGFRGYIHLTRTHVSLFLAVRAVNDPGIRRFLRPPARPHARIPLAVA